MKRNLEYYLFIKTGSIFENQINSGISHFLEHLIFDRAFERQGISDFLDKYNIKNDAQTFNCATEAIFWPLDKKLLQNLKSKIKKVILSPEFNNKDIKQERKIVKEEISFRKQQPDTISWRKFYEFVFQKTPLANEVLGTTKNLNGFTIQKLNNWHKRFYVNQNISEFIFNKDSGKIEVLSSNFKIPTPKINLKSINQKQQIKYGLSSKIVNIGWHFNNPTTKERVSLDILRRLIYRIFIWEKLILEKSFIYDGGVYLLHYKNFDFLTIQFFSTQPQKCLQELQRFKKELLTNKINQSKFELVKNFEKDYFLEPNPNITSIIGEEFIYTDQLFLPKQRLEIIKSITYQDILESARILFSNGENLQIVL